MEKRNKYAPLRYTDIGVEEASSFSIDFYFELAFIKVRFQQVELAGG